MDLRNLCGRVRFAWKCCGIRMRFAVGVIFNLIRCRTNGNFRVLSQVGQALWGHFFHPQKCNHQGHLIIKIWFESLCCFFICCALFCTLFCQRVNSKRTRNFLLTKLNLVCSKENTPAKIYYICLDIKTFCLSYIN